MRKTKWGILGTAKIARREIIRALQESSVCELVAVASRDINKAVAFAKEYTIPVAYGSYEELLSDPSIDIIYNPLPNHMHVEWIIQAVRAGKHVLCEKPLALSLEDITTLIALRDEHTICIGEAYAMLHQERLQVLKGLLASKQLGELQHIQGCFFLSNNDPQNIRNAYEHGGGSLWDIGVYPIAVGRYLFGEEPIRCCCTMYKHPQFNVDHYASGILEFPDEKVLHFSCGMNHPFHTHMTCYTHTHRIEVANTYFSETQKEGMFEVFDQNRPPVLTTHKFKPINQYRIECEQFASYVCNNTPFAGSLEHTYAQTKVLLALRESALHQRWESI